MIENDSLIPNPEGTDILINKVFPKDGLRSEKKHVVINPDEDAVGLYRKILEEHDVPAELVENWLDDKRQRVTGQVEIESYAPSFQSLDSKLNKLCEIAIIQLLESQKQNKELKEALERDHAQLKFLVAEAERRQMEENLYKQKKLEKMRNKNKRKTLRSPVKNEDYNTIMSCVKDNKELNCALYRVGLTVLFLTGIRIGNLRKITVNELKQLFNGQDFTIQSIKSKDNKLLSFPSSKAYETFLDLRRRDYELIMLNTGADEYVWQMTREHLTRKVNEALKAASVLLNKNLKSHSFRIGIATSIAEKYSIFEAQAILGHARIGTTEKYVHSRLTKREKVNIMNDILSEQSKPTELEHI